MAHDFKINEDDGLIQKKRTKTPGGIVGMVIKTGIVKTESQANLLLIVFIILGISAIIYLNLSTFS